MYNLILLVSALSTPTFVLPPDPDLIDKPDTVISYEDNQLYGTFVLKYNNDGYIIDSRYSGKSDLYVYYSYTGSYSRNGDTITGTYSDTTVDKYIVNQNNLVVKSLTYADKTLLEIDSMVYNNAGKLTKIFIQKIVPDDNTGDSVIFSYDPSNVLKTATTYNDGGTVWDYIEYEHDGNNRISKAIYFDCTAGCTRTNSYDTYRYSSAAVRNKLHIAHSNFYTMKSSPDMIHLTFYNGVTLHSFTLYDLSGNKVNTDADFTKSGGIIHMNNCADRVYILRMNTSKGMIAAKISVPHNQ
jgi:hypothetical protein